MTNEMVGRRGYEIFSMKGRVCQSCGEWKMPHQFQSHYDPYCKDCLEASYDAPHWRDVEQKAQPARYIRVERASDVRRYLFEQQHGCCAVCQQSGIPLVIDHDHDTGMVRGLLCSHCNSALGFLRDDVRALRRAIEYLTINQRNPTGIQYRDAVTASKSSRRRQRGR